MPKMKGKFYFDYDSLTYKQHEVKRLHKIHTAVRCAAVGVALGVGVYVATYQNDITLNGIALRRSNRQAAERILALEPRLDRAAAALAALKETDDNLYRTYTELSPLPATIRQAGFGGVGRYTRLQSMTGGESLSEIARKADILESQIRVQESSFNDIEAICEQKSLFHASVPAISPLEKSSYHRISDPFGRRFHPIFRQWKSHQGIDFAARIGTPVHATGDGVVTASEWASGYGHRVIIDHGFGYTTIYAHLHKKMVKAGDKVTRGQRIGTVGNSGNSTGPHLHYEVRKAGQPVNPAAYYIDDLTKEEYHALARK